MPTDTRSLIEELRGTECRCGRTKKAHQTFCSPCYFTLPKNQQQDLYKGMGSGYGQAYETAVSTLKMAGRIEE